MLAEPEWPPRLAPMQQHPSRTAVPEHRWPPVAALAFVLVLYWFAPRRASYRSSDTP